MATSRNKYFTTPAEPPSHPRIKSWMRRKKNATRVDMELYRSRDGLVRGIPRIFVNFYSDSEEYQDEVPWEIELDDWLIENGVHAVSTDNEKERWALHITNAFRPTINRYGEGYFNAVLVGLIKAGPFAEHPKVKEMLHDIHENRPSEDSLRDCEEMIEERLYNLAERVKRLYSDQLDVAEDVLAGALANYLDERYSISDRRLLGWTK